MTLRERAEKIGRDKKLLRRRIIGSISLLKKEFRILFDSKRSDLFDFEKQRFYSKCGKYALQWINNGKTSTGSVYLVDVPKR